MATPAEIREIVRVVVDALQDIRSGSIGPPATPPGLAELTEVLRAKPDEPAGKFATRFFRQWRANDLGKISMRITAGDGQSELPGRPVPTPPSVKVLDSAGRPVGDMPVRFTVTEGEGAIDRARVTTDPNGIAAVPWTLGPNQGENRLVASIEGSEVTFTATAKVQP